MPLKMLIKRQLVPERGRGSLPLSASASFRAKLRHMLLKRQLAHALIEELAFPSLSDR